MRYFWIYYFTIAAGLFIFTLISLLGMYNELNRECKVKDKKGNPKEVFIGLFMLFGLTLTPIIRWGLIPMMTNNNERERLKDSIIDSMKR